ncbi:MAG: FG-GAP-like repeat-containing protein [Bacteroidetes bacterium]|nr:FG-GAP-like repeat-containing protein [Bacteroidota bacterium]
MKTLTRKSSIFRLRSILLTSIGLFTVVRMAAQIPVTVTYSGNTTPAMALNYSSLASALSALNSVTAMNGPVILTCTGGHNETAPSAAGFTLGSSTLNPVLNSTHTITINTSGGTVTLVAASGGTGTPSSAVQDCILKLVGTDYLTIDGLTLVDSNTNNPATMECGIALYCLNASDGCQNNTIKNCTISLNRVNTAAGTSPMVDGSVGIFCGNAVPAAATTSLTPTGTSGTNSYNKFYHNTIQNCITGILISGNAATSGYPLPPLGDKSNDIGGNSAENGNIIHNFGNSGTYISLVGIRVRQQWGINISYNDIDNNDGNGVIGIGDLYGVWAESGNSANVDINYNHISLKVDENAYKVYGIENCIGNNPAGNTVNMNHNFFTGNIPYSENADLRCIFSYSNAQTVNINDNTISSISVDGYIFAGIFVFSTPHVNIMHNHMYDLHFTSNLGETSLIRVNSCDKAYVFENLLEDFTSGAFNELWFYYGGYNLDQTVSGNICRNLQGNCISPIIYTHNSTGIDSIVDNQITNITATSGIEVRAYQSAYISGNTIHNLTWSTIYDNAMLAGIKTDNGNNTICYNRIDSLVTWLSEKSVAGISLNSPANLVYNNVISKIYAPNWDNTSKIFAGIFIGVNGSDDRLYDNTIFLDATTTGGNFSTQGIYTNTGNNLDLSGNLVVNLSVPQGSNGYTCAYKRASNTLSTYSGNSGNNLFYAGTPGPHNLIFYDNTNACQTISAFQSLVSPRDAASISEMPHFLSTDPNNAQNLHIDPAYPTGIESGGYFNTDIPITGDFDHQIRPGNTGYSGSGVAPDIGAFEFAGTAIFNCTTPTEGTVSSSTGTICGGQDFTLSVQGSSTSGTGNMYQWYVDGNPTGSHEKTWKAQQLNTHTYSRHITCMANNASASTNSVTVITTPKTLPYVYGFNTSPLSDCWSIEQILWSLDYTTGSGTPYEGTGMFLIQANNGTSVGRLVSPSISIPGMQALQVNFYMLNSNLSTSNSGKYLKEGIQVQYSFDGQNWTNSGPYFYRHDPSLTQEQKSWELKSLVISADIAGHSQVLIGFKIFTYGGDDFGLDAFNVTEKTPCPPASCNPGTDVHCNRFTASWQPVTQALNYRFDMATDAGFSNLVSGYSNLNAGNVTSLLVTGLSPATQYFYRVRACDAYTSSINSNVIPVTTATPIPVYAGSNSPVCNGGALALTTTTGLAYNWSGPNGFNSAVQNPAIQGVTTADSGTYHVTVTDLNGCTAVANPVLVSLVPRPVLTGFTPESGPAGTAVTLSGTDFHTLAANNIVYFGATRATVSSISQGAMTVIVPAGATYQPITVSDLICGITNYTTRPFIPTYNCGAALDDNSFDSPVIYTSGANPNGIIFSDLDGDGKPDMIITNKDDNSISVLKNTGSSGVVSFGPKTDYPTMGSNWGIAAADLNGDGLPDPVVASENTAYISVYLNTSTGGNVSLGNRLDIYNGSGPEQVQLADIDGDGRTDIVVTTWTQNSVAVYLNLTAAGVMAFAPKVTFTTGSSPYGLTVGDLDGDGKPDLAVSNYNGSSMSIFRNTSTPGNISFEPKIDMATGTVPIFISQGDFNGDHLPELVVVNDGAASVSMFRNTCTSGAISFQPAVVYSTGSYPYTVAISDLTGDGKPEMAVTNYMSNSVSLFTNTSTPATVSFATPVNISTSNHPRGDAIVDVDGDGQPDLIIAGAQANQVSVYRNKIHTTIVAVVSADGPTTFCQGGSVTLTANSGYYYTWSNGAATQSIMISSSGTYTVTVSNNAGCSTVSNPVVVTVNTPPVITCPVSQEVNNDADQCGAVVNYPPATVSGSPAPMLSYSIASGSFFPAGTTVVTVSADNQCASATCSFNIKVDDNQAPSISCPTNINANATTASGAVVTYDTPSGSDNCPGAGTTLTAGLASGSTFPTGVTNVIYTIVDGAGLSSTCSFTVTVTGVAPQIVCPSNITLNAIPGQCGNYVNFAATENTGIPASEITYSLLPGSFFDKGITSVTATATNAVGTSSCTFTVTINDNDAPVINCPASITAGQCNSVVNYTVTATDNCPGPVSIVTAPASGSTFPVGLTTVTSIATDASGNQSSCSFTVNILSNPTITAGYNTGLCQGTTLSLTASGGASYSWTGPNGYTSTAQNPNRVNSTPSMSGIYTVLVTNENGCTSSATVNVVINPLPGTPTAITGASSVLRGGSYTYTATISNANSCIWSYSGTGVTISGNTSTVTIAYSCNATNGNLTVRGNNSCGNGPVASVPVVTAAGSTINIYCAKLTIGPGHHPTTIKTAMMPVNEAGSKLGFKVFRSNQIGITAKRKNYDNIWFGSCAGVQGSCNYNPASNVTESVTVTGPVLTTYGGGPAYKYIMTVPAGKRYLIIAKEEAYTTSCSPALNATNPCYVYVGKRTLNRNNHHQYCDEDDDGDDDGDDDSHFPGCYSKEMFLQIIQNANGKISPSNTDAIPGSLLLISSPNYLEFTDTVALLPIVYESVDGLWDVATSATPPEGFFSIPEAELETEVNTSYINALQFTIVDTGSVWTNTHVVSQLSHNNKMITHIASPDMINHKMTRDYLLQNFPNPFISETTIPYLLPVECHVKLSVYNMMGDEVSVLTDENQQKGQHHETWHACDHEGCKMPGGVYFAHLQAISIKDGKTILNTKSMIFVK